MNYRKFNREFRRLKKKQKKELAKKIFYWDVYPEKMADNMCKYSFKYKFDIKATGSYNEYISNLDLLEHLNELDKNPVKISRIKKIKYLFK